MTNSKLDICFLPAYARLFEEEGGQSHTLEHQTDDGLVLHTFIQRPLEIGGEPCCDVVSPYGYGGPFVVWAKEGRRAALVASYTRLWGEYCARNRVVSEFIRFHPLLSNHEDFDALYEPQLYSLNVACNIALPMDELWVGFAHKVRKNVRRAREKGLVTHVDSSGDLIDDFLKIYYGTMDRRNAGSRYYFDSSFFERIHATLPGHFCYFYVRNGSITVSAELVLLGETGVMHSFLGGTNEAFFELRPNDLLKFAVIEWGKANGYHTFLLGGGASPQDGIYRYKLSFAPNGAREFYLAKKINDLPLYQQLTEQARGQGGESADPDFFPQYRAPRERKA